MFKINLYQICITLALINFPIINAETIQGSATLVNKTFMEPLTVHGLLSADSIKGTTLVVHGKADLKNSIFDETTIHGRSDLSKSVFNGLLTIHGRAWLNEVVAQKLVVHGATELRGSIVEQTTEIRGAAIIEKSELKNDVNIHGRCEAAKGDFKGNLTVHGSVELNGSSVSKETLIHGSARMEAAILMGPTTIHGKLKAALSAYKRSLTVVGSKIEVELSDVTAQDIIITIVDPAEGSSFWYAVQTVNDFFKNLFGSEKEVEIPTVKLKGKTVVNGSITFKNGTGIVIIQDSARIVGTVNGAQIKKA